MSTAKNTDIPVPKNKGVSGVGHASVLAIRMKSASCIKNIDEGTSRVSGLSLALNFHILIKASHHHANFVYV